jgi:hypothetical protein
MKQPAVDGVARLRLVGRQDFLIGHKYDPAESVHGGTTPTLIAKNHQEFRSFL